MQSRLRLSLATIVFMAAAPTTHAQDDALVARARAIHSRVIKLDTHVDFSPSSMGDSPPNYATGLHNQVDLPKMKAGYNGIFFSIYVGQGELTPAGYQKAYEEDVAKFDAVHKLAEKLAPDQIEIALTAADVRRIVKSGKLVALMGVENGYGIGTDITRVKEFADRGARYLSLAHNGHSQLSDSNTGEADNVWMWHGVSPLGKQVVAEANKWGIMMDMSHPSKESNMWVMANSKAPVIASHSAVRALCTTASRDMDDEQMLALKNNGGVMQTVAFSSYLVCTPATSHERTAALESLAKEYNLPVAVVVRGNSFGPGGPGAARSTVVRSAACSIGDPAVEPQPVARPARANPLDALDEATRTRYQSARDAIDVTYPAPVAARRANVDDLVNHIDYAVKLIGIDHVGISSDFDGGGGIDGFNCAAEAPNVTIELVRRGYTEDQIAKLWGGNLLRVMEQTERVAAHLQAAS